MVEGVGFTPGAVGGDDPSWGLWWGENLIGARDYPVAVQNPLRLVYSPHTYGPSVYMQPYFQDYEFPLNMPNVWDTHFASAAYDTGSAIVIGEMGGFCEAGPGVGT
jgi:endoglucanase